jgi:hypothetical protein
MFDIQTAETVALHCIQQVTVASSKLLKFSLHDVKATSIIFEPIQNNE